MTMGSPAMQVSGLTASIALEQVGEMKAKDVVLVTGIRCDGALCRGIGIPPTHSLVILQLPLAELVSSRFNWPSSRVAT